MRAHQFDSMGEQLDAIVQATEQATNRIMESVEKNDEAVSKLRESITDPAQTALLDQIVENGNNAIEACSFQDITGQRVNKVVKSITYVESRVTSLVELWGREQLAGVEVPDDPNVTAEDKLMNGPQLEGSALSQDEVDSLFD